MSIATEIERIKTNITNAYIKLSEKGATLPASQNSENLASTINTMSTSSSSSNNLSKITVNLDDKITELVENNVIEIIIPDTVTTIGTNFKNWTALTSITISDNITNITRAAFSGCTNLTNATIGNGLTTIGNLLFENCTNLTNVTLSNSITQVMMFAFQNCNSLTNINFKGTMNEWNNIKKSDAWNTNSAITTITCTDGTITL